MESVVIPARDGIQAQLDCFVAGSEVRPTKDTVDLPEPERRYWYRLHIASGPTERRVYVFCERSHAEKASAAIREAEGPVPVRLSVAITAGAINVTDVQFGASG